MCGGLAPGGCVRGVAHDGVPSFLKVRFELTARLMWPSGADSPQEREVAEFGVHLPAGSLPVPPKRSNERVMEHMMGVPVPQVKRENM